MSLLLQTIATMSTEQKALSGEDAVQAVLADVPLYAAGILALGVFTVFLIMQRANWSIVCLHCSAFAAFIAGILDLAQVLLRFGTNAKPDERWSTVTGLVTTREVFLSFSVGLRFLFFWFFVARSPPGDSKSESGQLHNGSWEKWGLVGIILKWLLVLLCAAITLLQILYRTVGALAKFGPVYEVESTVEIVTSACFILKILLNGYLSVISGPAGVWRWKPCVAYIPIIFALCINAAIPVGNMIQFLWSETVLGRLLQAVEVYVLIVAVCVFTLRRLEGHLSVHTRRANRTSSFRGLGGMSLHISRSPYVDLQVPQEEKPKTHSRGGSMADRLSSFLVPRALSHRPGIPFPGSPTGDKLWNQDDAERGVSPSLYSARSPIDPDRKMSRASFDDSPSEPKESAKWQDPLFSAVLRRSSPTPGEMLANAALESIAPNVSTLAIPPRAYSSSTSASSHADSPIYGLSGRQLPQDTMRSPLSESSSQTFPDSKRSSSYSRILRQQAELDKSIANLRLLARDSTVDGPTFPDDGGKPSSAASQSEFSLSNFPAPPWRMSSDTDYTVRAGTTPVVTISRADSIKSQKPSLVPISDIQLIPPKMPAVMEHTRNVSVPFSENDDPLPTGRVRVDSEGTQYEITSFIGNLTHKKDMSVSTAANSSLGGSPPKNRIFADTSSVDSSGDFPSPPRIITGRPIGLPTRPRLTVGAVQKLSPLAESASSPRDEFENPRRAPSP